MNTYELGPLTVEVESLGKVKSPWYSMENHYNVKVTDRHGHEFKAGWYSVTKAPEKVAWNIVSLLYLAQRKEDYENFVDYFSGGYRGEERSWRVQEAYRLKEAGKTFDERELIKAAAKASRKSTYEENRGPRDWSPIWEIPLE